MFQNIKTGWKLIQESVRVFKRYPKLLLPLLFVWVIYAAIILYMEYGFPWDGLSAGAVCMVALAVIAFFTFLLSFSCLLLLELIQQLESGQPLRMGGALTHTILYNLIKALPIIFIWTVIWFLLLMIQALLSRGKKEESRSFTAENAARTLAGYQRFSFSRSFFEALEKAVRMVIFLILPAIAWENLSFLAATKKGFLILRENLYVFVSGYVLTGLAASIIYLPPTLLLYSADKFDLTLPTWLWIIAIIYLAFGWSYSIYLEQMFSAELYLWNYKWQKAKARAEQQGLPIPALSEISRPTLLDDVYELDGKLV